MIDSSFLMINYDMPEFISNIQKRIPESELYYAADSSDKFQYGLETETHITLVPCLDNNLECEELKPYLMPLDSYKAMLEDVSVFHNEEFDVLKCSVRCKNLHTTNSVILSKYNSTSEFKTYHPHVTIAYLKKGCADKYKKQIITEPVFLIPRCFSFSWIENEKIKKIEFIK